MDIKTINVTGDSYQLFIDKICFGEPCKTRFGCLKKYIEEVTAQKDKLNILNNNKMVGEPQGEVFTNYHGYDKLNLKRNEYQMEKFTEEQAIVIMGFTGRSTMPFSTFHGDVEKRLGRPVFTHEFASNEMSEKLKEVYKEDFVSMCLS